MSKNPARASLGGRGETCLAPTSRYRRLALLVVLAACFFIRVHGLDAQSLWYDEGNSARIAERSIQLIVEGAGGDIHPPGYYLMLKLWRAGAGDGEAGLRSLSVMASMLCAACIAAIGRALRHANAGVLAAGIWTLHPFAIYYAQEARMYALLALWACVLMLLLLRVARCYDNQLRAPAQWRANVLVQPGIAQPSGMLAALALAAALGLYTQYAFVFVLFAAGVWFCMFYLRYLQARKHDSMLHALAPLMGVGGAMLLALLLFAPWLATAIRQVTTWPTVGNTVGGAEAIGLAMRWLYSGRVLSGASFVWLLAPLALSLVGLVSILRVRNGGLPVMWLLLPVLVFFAASLFREAYLKALLICVPPLCLLCGAGLDALLRATRPAVAWLRWPAMAGLILATGLGFGRMVQAMPVTPELQRDDYRGIARDIARDARAADAVFFLAPNQWEVFTYYQRDDRNLFPLKYRPDTEREADSELAKAVLGRDRVFGLFYADQDSDPSGWYARAIAQRLVTVSAEWRGNVQFKGFATMQAFVNGGPWFGVPNDFQIGPYTLRGGWRSATRVSTGDAFIVYFDRASMESAPPARMFLHVGAADAPPLAQFDVDLPEAGRVYHGVWLRDVPPGRYAVWLGLYDAVTGQRLPVSGSPHVENRVKVADIEVVGR